MPHATQAELEAILHGAALAPISDRAFLRITGPDATRWLNGMVTNSIQSLAPGEGNYNFLLNAQGRILADCTIYREPGDELTFLLETDSSQLETVQGTLDRFIIMDDVELSPALDDKVGMLVIGAAAVALLDRASIWPPEPISISAADVAGDPLVLATSKDRYEIWSNDSTLGWLRSVAHREVSPAALEAFRILSGTPRYGIDIRNTDTARDLPQETNQTHALHFSKGCYLGQEIVERIRSRGQVHRLFTRFRLAGDLPASLPAKLEIAGKPAGELTSAALVPLPEGPQLLALGYARREFLELRKELTYAGGTATPFPASNPTINHPEPPNSSKLETSTL